jgi:hypothetical protein
MILPSKKVDQIIWGRPVTLPWYIHQHTPIRDSEDKLDNIIRTRWTRSIVWPLTYLDSASNLIWLLFYLRRFLHPMICLTSPRSRACIILFDWTRPSKKFYISISPLQNIFIVLYIVNTINLAPPFIFFRILLCQVFQLSHLVSNYCLLWLYFFNTFIIHIPPFRSLRDQTFPKANIPDIVAFLDQLGKSSLDPRFLTDLGNRWTVEAPSSFSPSKRTFFWAPWLRTIHWLFEGSEVFR